MTRDELMKLCDYLECNDASMEAQCEAAAELRRLHQICLDSEVEMRRLHQICRDIYEVWAGSEGIPVPETAPEAYLLQLIEQMRDLAKEGLR